MKNIKIKLFSLLALLSSTFLYSAPPNGNIRCEWDYAPTEVTNVVFRLYRSTDAVNYTVLTNVVGSTNVDLVVTPGKNWFYVTASNFWGESTPSNIASTPAAPNASGNLKTTKLP